VGGRTKINDVLAGLEGRKRREGGGDRSTTILCLRKKMGAEFFSFWLASMRQRKKGGEAHQFQLWNGRKGGGEREPKRH